MMNVKMVKKKMVELSVTIIASTSLEVTSARVLIIAIDYKAMAKPVWVRQKNKKQNKNKTKQNKKNKKTNNNNKQTNKTNKKPLLMH